ncbi:transporter [Campylobacter sputorum subsp. bubulus]|uniref:Transporter n=1 Tax=Campylobacter sputorum subsp. sputorum TaxID=32024 RepID=A0A381DKS4_9BACT|nr:DMT family transporter [Campylobacter sputorum]ASM34493.1 putative membrane protein, putative permease (EamA domain), type 3 [Campylobacter sputorum aubsp. sputorum RM3237]KAB0582120.1 EamA family transporter [Campylobacter sputorum subsp. sputorum]QEL04684.1 EamA/RhaT family transporter, type 3 [Campylobacter sputorum subsp. sputorum]SUX09532.1 transporter [Campylobacter sputorum subsp. bubulus]SUX11157.1 transporter [Campylobacter sputorum subsp. sputorum]
MQNLYISGVFYAFFGGIFWGFSGACGQYLFMYKNIDPVWLTGVRLLGAGICLFVLMIIKQKRGIFKIFTNKSSLFQLMIYSFFGLMLCQYTYYETIKHSNVAIATILQYTAPAMIMILACLWYKKLPNIKEFFALICASIGLFLIATHGNLDKLIIDKYPFVIGMISALCVVIYSISPININKKYGTLVTLSWGLLISGVIFFVASNSYKVLQITDIYSFLGVCGVIFFGTILAFSFYMRGVDIIGPTKASMIASIEPISAMIFSYFWFGVKFVLLDYIGVFLILLCTILVSKK